MIKDNIKNFENHNNSPERVKIGLQYLYDTDFSNIKNGKYEIAGDEIFVSVFDYQSKYQEAGVFEAHRKYIDIQYIIKGEEQIGIANIENFENTADYDSEKDIVFLNPKKGCLNEFVKLKENEFIIFNPQDAHMPGIAVKTPDYVRKAVVKVLV